VPLRYVFPQEWETLLHYDDFDVTTKYGGADFSPLTATSRAIICLCRLATPPGGHLQGRRMLSPAEC